MMTVQTTLSFRRRTFLRPVNTLKHIVDIQGGLVAGTQAVNTIVKGVDNPVTDAVPQEVTVGSHVKSLFINIQVAATGTAAIANVYFIIFGNPGGVISVATYPNGNAVGTSDLRKMVFHQEMLMTEKNTTAIPRTLFKGVIRVPRKFQRIGSNDTLHIALFAPGVNFDFCFQVIYKEIR